MQNTSLTCPRCLKETPHISLEHHAQYTQSKHGGKIKKNGTGRMGKWVRCTICLLPYVLTEGKEKEQ